MTDFLSNYSLSGKTTYKIGGPARYYLEPENAPAIAPALEQARTLGCPVLVIGKGSNILVSDAGWPGLVINLSGLSGCSWEERRVVAEGGVALDHVARESVRRGLAGMEELSGIPGTVGGAVVMNAGAFETAVADTILEAVVLDMESGATKTVSRPSLHMGYRSSILQKMRVIVMSATFEFRTGNAGELEEKRNAILRRRKEKQPLELPNCGSVFKRPPGNFAGTLIEQAGLKGLIYGKAQISNRHANFIVNLGGATAAEVRHLIAVAQKTVYEKTGVLLEPEVVFAGEFEEKLMEFTRPFS